MFTIIQEMNAPIARSAASALALLFFLALSASGQTTASLDNNANDPLAKKPATQGIQPVSSIYGEIKIGTGADEVRKLLGKATIDDKDGFFYDMDAEVVQIRVDENKTVRLIAVTYPSDSPRVPKYVDIFGAEPVDTKPDGSIYKLVRYPEAGYWIAYSKTAGEKPSVTVTMQKL